MSKEEMLLKLAKKRQQRPYENYFNIEEIHNGIYECDFVSPRTKSANNIENRILLVLQDWIDKESLDDLSDDKRKILANLGYAPWMKTNENISNALNYFFKFEQSDIYITNVFPFIKPCKNKDIKSRDFENAAKEYLKPQIDILEPKLIICGGKEAARGVCDALDITGPDAPSRNEGHIYNKNGIEVVRVQHPGWGLRGWNALRIGAS